MSEQQNIHISYSEFSKYMECPHRHLIEKYLKLAEQPPSIHLYFGSAIHEAIEYGIREGLTLGQRIIHFKAYFTKEMIDNMRDTDDYYEMNNFIEQGENIIKILSTEKIVNKYDIVGVEEDLYENLYGNFYFKGFIDLIVRDRDTGRYIIIDWKTSSQAWNVKTKVKDKVFVSQMRFYKFFYGRKHNISFDQIDCKYIVLNRLKDKKNISKGFGEMQTVEMKFSEEDIMDSLKQLTEAIRDIHKKNTFPKSKIEHSRNNCFFCPYKNGHNLCNSNPKQYKILLEEHKKYE